MRKALIYSLLIGSIALCSCKADQICASYNSYFMVSAKEQPSVFSFQAQDTLPNHEIPELFALVSDDGLPRRDLPNTEKDKNGLVKSEWAIIKNWNKRIVPMEVVLPEVADSVLFAGDDIMFAERDVVDTLALDSARNAAQSVRYNNDQKFYNWYFREKLTWGEDAPTPDNREQGTSATAVTDNQASEPKEKKNFFKNIFNKEKTPSDSTGVGINN